MEFILPSLMLENDNTYSDIEVVKKFDDYDQNKYHGVYDSRLIFTHKDDIYPDFKLYIQEYGSIVFNRIHPNTYYDSNHKNFFTLSNSFVEKNFLLNQHSFWVLLSNLFRGNNSFLLQQTILDDNATWVHFDMDNMLKTEYDITGNELNQHMINEYFWEDKVELCRGWYNRDKNRQNLLFFENVIIHYKFNPLLIYPYNFLYFNGCTQIFNQELSNDTFLIANVLSKKLQFSSPKFLIRKPENNLIYKFENNNFVDITSSVDLTSISSFNSIANHYLDYFSIDDTLWENLLGNDNYLYFIVNDYFYEFVLRINEIIGLFPGKFFYSIEFLGNKIYMDIFDI